MKKFKLCGFSFLTALAVFVYVGLVVLFMFSMEKWGVEMAELWGPIMMLCLLVLSATIVGALVFGYPVYLLVDKKVKQALVYLLATIGWFFLIMVIYFLILFWV